MKSLISVAALTTTLAGWAALTAQPPQADALPAAAAAQVESPPPDWLLSAPAIPTLVPLVAPQSAPPQSAQSAPPQSARAASAPAGGAAPAVSAPPAPALRTVQVAPAAPAPAAAAPAPAPAPAPIARTRSSR